MNERDDLQQTKPDDRGVTKRDNGVSNESANSIDVLNKDKS